MKKTAALVLALVGILLLCGAYLVYNYLHRPMVYISEVCPSNDGKYKSAAEKDAKGELCDWVELYNASDYDTTLEEFAIRKNNDKVYCLEDVTIRSKEYVLIYCSKDGFEGTGTMGIDMNIPKNESCTLELLHDGRTVSKVETSPVERGRSIAVNKKTPFVTEPTPCAANSRVHIGETPVFSADSGFYEEGFELTITAGEGQRIFYTTDGTDPRTSDTRLEYSGAVRVTDRRGDKNVLSAIDPVNYVLSMRPGNYSVPTDSDVEKCTVIRACSQGDNDSYSLVRQMTYFVGISPEDHGNMPVISMAIDPDDLFDDDRGIYCLGNIYKEYAAEHPDHKYNGSVPANYNQKGREWERECQIQFYEGDGTLQFSQNAGVRIQGGWSRSEYQKSLRFFARSEYGEGDFDYSFWEDENRDSVDTFLLRNGGNDTNYTKFKDAMFQKMAEGNSFSTQASRPCVLFINGEYWGFYNLCEDYSKEYFADHFNVDKDSVAIYKNGELDEGTNADEESFDKLFETVTTYDMSRQENYLNAEALMDMEGFAEYAAAECYIFNDDWPHNNYGCWKADKGEGEFADGKWRFFMFDTESSACHYNSEKIAYGLQSQISIQQSRGIGKMLMSLLDNKDFRDMFIEKLKLMSNVYSYENVTKYTEEYKTVYFPEMEKYFKRFPTKYTMEGTTQEMLERMDYFFKTRKSYLRDWLSLEVSDWGG